MKRRKKSHAKPIAVLLIVMFTLVIIIAVALNKSNQSNQNKPPADKYLKIQHTKSIGEFYGDQNSSVLIKILGLNITALGGNAYDIWIDLGTPQSDTEYPYAHVSDLPKGNSTEVQITTSYSTELENGFFPVYIDVWCNEAKIASVLLLLNPNDIVHIPGTVY